MLHGEPTERLQCHTLAAELLEVAAISESFGRFNQRSFSQFHTPKQELEVVEGYDRHLRGLPNKEQKLLVLLVVGQPSFEHLGKDEVDCPVEADSVVILHLDYEPVELGQDILRMAAAQESLQGRFAAGLDPFSSGE